MSEDILIDILGMRVRFLSFFLSFRRRFVDGVLRLNILEVASFSYSCLYMILCVVGFGSGFAAYSKPIRPGGYVYQVGDD